MTSSVDTYAAPAELVRRLLDADAHHDLAGYRALLADEFTEETEGEVLSRRGDDAAYAAARSWALAPGAYRTIDDLSEAAGCVMVRYRLDRAVPPGVSPRERPGNFLGYSIYETRDGHIVRAGHFFSEHPDRDGATAPRASQVEAAPSPVTATRQPARRHPILAGLTVVLSVLLAEPLWAAPVVATTAWRGGGVAFALFVPLYFVLGYAASLLVIRWATSSATPGWFERWLREGAERRHLQRIRRLVQAGTFLGFVLSSVFFGAIVTTWLLLQLGRRRNIRRNAAASSLIFSVGFVAFYAGIASLIF